MAPLLLLLALAQDPALQGPPAPGARGEWRRLNGIYLIVNEEVVTRAQFYRSVRRNLTEATTEQDLQDLERREQVGFVRNGLMTQAGRDLGFDPERVRKLVEDDRKEMIERAGSVTAFSQQLAAGRATPEEFREFREDFYYGLLWRAAVSGESQGAGGRPYVDRFVRPGRLLYEYRLLPPDRILPDTVRIQEIVVGIGPKRGSQEAKDLAEEIRNRALAGEDFGKLAQSYSDSNSRIQGGRVSENPIRVEDASRIVPNLAEFFENGRAGDISEVQPMRNEATGELESFQILRLEDVDRPGEVPLADVRVQEALRRRRTESLSALRINRALKDLFEGAYVWPAPETSPDAAGEPAGAR
jgi:hypothetical protein